MPRMTKQTSACCARAAVSAVPPERRSSGGRLLAMVLAPAAVLAWGALSARVNAQVTPDRVLLLWNSQNADSQAVRDMYVAARPGVLEFDLNDDQVEPGNITRNKFNARVLEPLREFLNGVNTGEDISQQVIVIATTRGLPARISGPNEFALNAELGSFENELVMLQQSIEAAGTTFLPFHYSGLADNPMHALVNPIITNFSRADIRTQRTWTAVNMAVSPAGQQTWRVNGLTPGDMYLVCRIDAAPTQAATALENVQALLDRSASLVVRKCEVQALLDEYTSAQNQLDDDGLDDNNSAPFIFPPTADFESTANVLNNAVDIASVTHDETNNFITWAELADQTRPILVFGTYGENHDVVAGGEDPPGTGTYVEDYTYHPAAMFSSYESFNGNSLIDGTQRQGQQQALDFISAGGSFIIPTVAEPFTFAVTDLQHLANNMLVHGRTFAEAAYTAIPALSWQSTPVGDPLATITVLDNLDPDRNADGTVDARDLYAHFEAPDDIDCSGAVNAADGEFVRDAIRENELTDIRF